MKSLTKHKNVAMLGISISIVVGCTATGGLDFVKIAGTLLQVASYNYPATLVSSVDAVLSAFTGETFERPNVQQYPAQPYPGQQYPAGQSPEQYPTAQYPGYQYPETQNPYYQYPDSQYPSYQYPDATVAGYPQQGGQPQSYPQQEDPYGGSPQQGYPQQTDPYGGYPQQGGQPQGYPQQEDPYGGSPQQGYPPQTDPYGGYPQQGGQPQGYPQQGDPYGGYAQQGGQYGQQQGGGYSQQAWQSWGEPFPATVARSVPDAGALSIDLALFTMMDGQPVGLPDGARLRDGVGRDTEGDRFGIAFATKEPAYVYIVNIDATGWAQTLFPYPDVPGFDNPVAAGKQILLPNDQLYGLDDTRGIETVFVMVARSPNHDLEKALEPLRGKERSAMVGQRGATARVSIPMVGQRGLAGVTPAASQSQRVSLDRYFTARSTDELAFSRWFVHE